MKYIALIAAITLIQANAAHAFGHDDIMIELYCEQTGKLGGEIMANRQKGVALNDQLSRIKKGTRIDREIVTIAKAAYDIKIVPENSKIDVVVEYAKNVYDICIETNVFGKYD